jgi:hypothetical protein
MSRLSPIEGLELEFFEQLISISLEFESVFRKMTWLASNQLSILAPPYIGVKLLF